MRIVNKFDFFVIKYFKFFTTKCLRFCLQNSIIKTQRKNKKQKIISLEDFGSEFWHGNRNFHRLFNDVSEFALSFDGYKYSVENKDFTPRLIYKNTEALLEGREIPETQFVPQLFFLQRGLGNGQYEINDRTYKIFYELFLKCLEISEDIEEGYRQEEYYEKWKKKKNNLQEIINDTKNILESVNWK